MIDYVSLCLQLSGLLVLAPVLPPFNIFHYPLGYQNRTHSDYLANNPKQNWHQHHKLVSQGLFEFAISSSVLFKFLQEHGANGIVVREKKWYELLSQENSLKLISTIFLHPNADTINLVLAYIIASFLVLCSSQQNSSIVYIYTHSLWDLQLIPSI